MKRNCLVLAGVTIAVALPICFLVKLLPSSLLGQFAPGNQPTTDGQEEPSEQAFLANCKAARAAIVTLFAGPEIGTGSVISPDGLVVTNEHVVRQLEDGLVRARSWEKVFYTGKVIATDPVNDLALIQLKTATKFQHIIEREKPGLIQPGETVCALGSPRAVTGVLAWGILLGYRGENDLRSSILLHPGNSGGPLLNARGKMIGVNKSIWRSQTGRNDGLSFATNATTDIIANLIKRGQPYLLKQGSEYPISAQIPPVATTTDPLFMQPPAPPATEAPGLLSDSVPLSAGASLGAIIDRQTLVIQIVEPESPAEKAGLNAGDRLLAVNGEPLQRLEDLQGFLNRNPDSALLTLERQQPLQGQQKVATVAVQFK